MSTTLTFSKNDVANFGHTNKALRYGQQFHQYFKLDKITGLEDQTWCRRLYCAGDKTAKAMIAERTDDSQ